MSNRRRSERFTVTLPVTLKDGKGGEVTKTANVSAHGIAVFSAHPRPLRQYLELDVALPDNAVPINITAVVARHADKLPTGNGSHTPGLGLDFFLFDARAKQAWSQFLSELRRKGLEIQPDEPPPVPLEPPFDDTPTFIIKPRDLGRLWAFYRGEMTKGRVRIETPIIKPIGTRVELLVVHPSSQAEWVLEGSIATTNQNARGGRPVLEIELENLGPEQKGEFRNFVATGRGMIEEDVSMSLEVPAVVRNSLPPEPSVRQIDLDDEQVEMPPTVLAEPAAVPEPRPIEEEEFRYESVVIDLDNLGDEELRSGIVDAPPPLADEEATLDRDPDPQPLRPRFDEDETSEPTLTPHSPEVKEDPELRQSFAPSLPPAPEMDLPSNRSLFGAFFEEAAEEEVRRSFIPAPSIKLERTARLRPPSSLPRMGSSPPPMIDDLIAPQTGLRPVPQNGRAMPPEVHSSKPPPAPLPSGDEPFEPLPDVRVLRGAPQADEPLTLERAELGEMAPQVRGVSATEDVAQNPPVPGSMFEYSSEQLRAEAPLLRPTSKRPPPLPPSARRRAIKETAGAPSSSPSHQAVKSEGTDPELDRDIALARARVVRSPNSVTACYRLSALLLRRGEGPNLDDALSTLLRVMELEPNHPGAHHKLAEVFARRGDYVQASEHLNRARRLGYRTDPDLEAVVAHGVRRTES